MSAATTSKTRPEPVQLGGLGVNFLLDGDDTDGRFSLVEHPIAPRALAAPVHTHLDEDEYSYVLEGLVGVEIGDETIVAGPGQLVRKPRGVPHAFWNAGDEPARVLEIISPAGFERFFTEAAVLMESPEPDEAAWGDLLARFRLDMDFSTVERLAIAHQLVVDPVDDQLASPAKR